MSDACIVLKESNCRNCYKCIRQCPVKSIRFASGEATVIDEDCILCGRCVVACPQGAKQPRCDLPRARFLMSFSGAPRRRRRPSAPQTTARRWSSRNTTACCARAGRK